jgi:hypothetical protein
VSVYGVVDILFVCVVESRVNAYSLVDILCVCVCLCSRERGECL